MEETYLGDRLYFSHDGVSVRLRVGDHVVYLNPEVLANFLAAIGVRADLLRGLWEAAGCQDLLDDLEEDRAQGELSAAEAETLNTLIEVKEALP